MSSFEESIERIRLLHEADELAELRRAAESRPPAPTWTSEPPSVAGWYWVHRGMSPHPARPEYIGLGVIATMKSGDWSMIRYAGPIPEPPPSRECLPRR